MIVENERYKLLLGDFREVGKQIEDNSIDMIFVDPPYLKEYIPIYTDLGAFAFKKLKDGGRLIAYSNTTSTNKCINGLDKHLKFVGIIGLQQTGMQISMIFDRRIMTYMKFLLFYVKGKYIPISPISNLIASKYQGKQYHGWQQSTIEATYLITYLTKKDETVCDPMMGSGTTGVATLSLERNFIGIEIDPNTIKTAEKRIRESRNYNLEQFQTTGKGE